MGFTNLDIKKWIFIFLSFSASAAFLTAQATAAENTDAIAVRVIPNATHYGIDRWYNEQGYKGSPQKLIVDGYEAIRDGRTVFVNASNVENGKIYTNIYLISYNQEPDNTTLDILGQLVSHWKFNNNLPEKGVCSISKMACLSSSDCPSSYICSTGNIDNKTGSNPSNKGRCILKEGKMCNNDSDCPANIFCDSVKAKVTRDVKRLADLNEIRSALDSFKINNISYPPLNSGTYIPGNTISTWPSWAESLGSKLGRSNFFIDPINSLGDCPGFEVATCWKKGDLNNDANNFYKLGASQKPIFPLGSYAYMYTAKNNGAGYDLCANFETHGLYDTSANKISTQACQVTDEIPLPSPNTAPTIKNISLEGGSGHELDGYLQAADAENDTISWSLSVGSTNFNSWGSVPALQDSGVLNQKRVYSSKAGAPGNYPVTLTLTDSRGATASYPLIILISNAKPLIQADDMEYIVDPITPLNYSFFIQASKGIASYTFRIKNGSPDVLLGIQGTKTEFGPNRWGINYSVLIPNHVKIYQDRELTYTITAIDNNNASISKDIKISLKSTKPLLDFDCDTNARVNRPYPINNSPCRIGNDKQGNHSIYYALANFPSLGLQSSNGQVFLSGTTTIANASGSPVTINAINEYGATSSKSFNLKVNTYCGDGIAQSPNSERKGGAANNGMESCDGEANVTKTLSLSPLVQYGCKTKPGFNVYPILDNSSCTFEDSTNGGGYCGDGVCQLTIIDGINGINIENPCNCSSDCGQPIPGTCSNCQSDSDCSDTLPVCSNGTCVQCAEGTWNNAGTCTTCPAGSNCTAGNKYTCAANSYSGTGQASCTSCAAGKSSRGVTGATSSVVCQNCPIGTTSAAGHNCTVCGGLTYNPTAGSTCIGCWANSVGDGTGTSCITCTNGKVPGTSCNLLQVHNTIDGNFYYNICVNTCVTPGS